MLRRAFSEPAAKGNVHKRKLSRKHLNICHLNARSLKNKLTEVKLIALEYDVDIIAVSETWFDLLTYPADTSLVGFQAPFRRDRADAKRGLRRSVQICQGRYCMHKKTGS